MAGPTLFYNNAPSLQQLRDDFFEYIQENPQFQGYVKVGKTSRHNLRTRYSLTDKYEQLDETNIFCYCASEDIALEVETMVQELTKENDTFIWRSDSGKGSSGGDKKEYLVYVTTLKLNLFKCPLESCSTVMTKEGIEEHKMSHAHITSTIAQNEALIEMSLPLMTQRVTPIPVSIFNSYLYNIL